MFFNTKYSKSLLSMRKIFFLILLGLGCHFTALAQPSFLLTDGSACTNEQVCLNMTVKDFTDLNAVSFTLGWDAAVLSNATVTGFGVLAGLSAANFTIDNVEGRAVLNWTSGACNAPGTTGFTLADDVVLFQICFTVIGSYGDLSEVRILEAPVPVINRVGVSGLGGCVNLGIFGTTTALVTSCVRPVRLIGSDETANPGDLVCMDFTLEGFDQMRGAQFTMNWDPAVLEPVQVIPGSQVPNMTAAGNFAVFPSYLTVSWFYFVVGQPPVTLPDGTTFFTVCFRIIGPCESTTAVSFSSSPTLIEFTNDNTTIPGYSIPFLPTPGSVTATECDPTGLQVNADCGSPVNLLEEVCVRVTAGSNFTNINDLAFLMNWNSTIMEFVEVRNINPAFTQFPNTQPINFNAANAGNGVLGVEWNSGPFPNVTLAAGDLMWEVCFVVERLGGNSPFIFSNPSLVRVGNTNTPNIGINPTNCEVTVNQPPGVLITVNDAQGPVGEETCVDVNLSSFQEVIDFQFSLNWDPLLFEYNGVNIPVLNPLNINAATHILEFGVDNGSLSLDWSSAAPISIIDGTTIFQVCLTPIGAPGVCEDLSVVPLPLAPQAVTASSNGNNVGVTGLAGEVCTLYPEGFGLIIAEATGLWRDTACVPVSVESFDNITLADFAINWNSAELTFAGINNPGTWPGLTAANFTINASVGSVEVDWTAAAGTAIPDGTVVFELCFVLDAEPSECYDVSVTQSPAPVVQTTNGIGSLLFTNGEMCIQDRFIVVDTIMQESCPGACDGRIALSVVGGRGNVSATWDSQPLTQFGLVATNLCAGEVSVTIFDSGNPTLLLTDTFFIPAQTVMPMANAGQDRVANCDPPLTVITGSGDLNAAHSWQWFLLGGSLSGPVNQASFLAPNPGSYEFRVTNTVTGCVARDTMVINPPILPQAEAGEEFALTCQLDTASLSAAGSSSGIGINYTWTAFNGGNIVAGDQNMANPRITSAGRYVLTVRSITTGCEARDTVLVVNGQDFPSAITSGSVEVSCIGEPVCLDASMSENNPADVTYRWLDSAGNQVGTGVVFCTTVMGDYTVEATSLFTGCTATAFASVVPNTSGLPVELGEDISLDCILEQATINATVGSSLNDYTFQWNVLEGAPLVPGTETELTPQVNGSGLYELVVTNAQNCVSSDTVAVALNNTLPTAIAGNNGLLICDVTSVTLDGTASQADNLTYLWTNSAGDTIAQDMLIVEVQQADTYILSVMDTLNGCSSIDSVLVELSEDLPQVTISPSAELLTCVQNTLDLSAAVSPADANYTFAWSVVSGDGTITSGADAAVASISGVATYQVMVTDADNGCEAVQTFVVDIDNETPTADAGAPADITCLVSSVMLGGSSTSVGDNITYTWQDEAGMTVGSEAMLASTAAGTYTLTVLNTVNGCDSTSTVLVSENIDSPEITVGAVDELTCVTTCATLTATVANAANFAATWSGPGLPVPSEVISAEVCEVGQYVLAVTNTDNGCETTDTVTVVANIEVPSIAFAQTDEFTCITSTVDVNATQTGAVADFSSITWAGPGTVSPATGALAVGVDAPGLYTLTVVRADNGCEATDTVTVAENRQEPTIAFAQPSDFNCNSTGVDIDATATGSSADFSSITWSGPGAVSPATGSLTVSVDAAGDYLLTVVSAANGCSATDTITVSPDQDTPVANAGTDFEIGCGETTNLDGSQSSQGAGFTYQWTVLSGTGMVNNPTALNPDIDGEGTFLLTVSNASNGCNSTDTVTVVQELPAEATVQDNLTLCENTATLTGNAPVGTTGVWTSTSAAVIAEPNSASTGISAIPAGSSTFIWTLSAPGCPEYSSATLMVSRPDAPVLSNDVLTISADTRTGMINVLANDMLAGVPNPEVTLTANAVIGQATLNGGVLTFQAPMGASGNVEVTYQVCAPDCPGLCATATVLITIISDGFVPEIPNTITPNGDGINDRLFFDVIANTPAEKIPDNELVIFNRWGDIVYQKKNYNNDWEGRNADGSELPQATYYYILRLNIANGDIIRGDVTILK